MGLVSKLLKSLASPLSSGPKERTPCQSRFRDNQYFLRQHPRAIFSHPLNTNLSIDCLEASYIHPRPSLPTVSLWTIFHECEEQAIHKLPPPCPLSSEHSPRTHPGYSCCLLNFILVCSYFHPPNGFMLIYTDNCLYCILDRK